MKYSVEIPKIGAVDVWRKSARQLLALGIAPELVHFGTGTGLFAMTPLPTQPKAPPAVTLSKSAVQLIETALCHADPERFDRAYALIWRLKERQVRFGDRSDRAMRKIMAQAKEVRRDIHKMHAFVRFREGPPNGTRRAFAAWFEPTHNIVETATPFFAKRFGDMDWMIKTPELTALFRDGVLTFEETTDPAPPPDDATEELWCRYYAAIFNPARLMVSAMQSEMPQKYWKNLPETLQIPQLIRSAAERVDQMKALAPSQPPAFARAIARQPSCKMAHQATSALEKTMLDARRCTRCSIGGRATQLVWGEGPTDAKIMIVGEQPGDQEDLSGRPFNGPAGAVLDMALEKVGFSRDRVYITNAVKHFKFKPRGKRRIHQRPNTGEVDACRWWLEFEIQQVRPFLIVALGATAARALTGSGDQIADRRGQVETGFAALPVFLTIHPAYLLRLRNPAEASLQTQRFHEDITLAISYMQLLEFENRGKTQTQI
ncbi:MAG: UdgX family uracil-DNA binding protein [Pseudomonadota bacterium]